MKLKYSFRGQEKGFDACVAARDVEALDEFLARGYKPKWQQVLNAAPLCSSESFRRLLAASGVAVNDQVSGLWSLKEPFTHGQALLVKAIEDKALHLIPVLLDDYRVNCNSGPSTTYKYDHPAIVLTKNNEITDRTRQTLLSMVLAGGIDKIERKEMILQAAIETGRKEEADIIIAAGVDPHGPNQWALRHAARRKNPGMCRHLVARHGADVDLALMAGRILPDEEPFQFLTILRDELAALAQPQPKPPATVESLARDIADLRAAVSELTSVVQKLAENESRQAKPLFKLPHNLK